VLTGLFDPEKAGAVSEVRTVTEFLRSEVFAVRVPVPGVAGEIGVGVWG
jgi:hypothetical protein